MKKIRLAIVEDEEDIRDSLHTLLLNENNIEVEAIFANGESALQALEKHPVEVLLCDINLPGISGIEVIGRLKTLHPSLQCMVLSSYDDPDYIFHALRAGATGYILKNTPTPKLLDAIQDIYQGGSPMSSQIARKVVLEFAGISKPHAYTAELSRRENEILDMLAKGFRYKEIATQFFISTETVKSHIRNIYEKLQVNTRAEALKKTGLHR